jgi:Spy/CpxP family protein refolding chaperone
MTHILTNSRKAVAGGMLAILLGTTSIMAIAADDRPDKAKGMKDGQACVDERSGGFGMHRRDQDGMGMGMGQGMERMDGRYKLAFRGLDLTDKQRDDIRDIRDSMQKDRWAVTGKMMDAHNKIRDLREADKFDAKAINKAYEELAELQQEMFMIGVQAKTSMVSLLTTEQRQQLKEERHHGARG